MPPKDDHLSNEVSLVGHIDLDAKKVSAGARSRAISSIDRLVGSVIDIGSAYCEAKAQKIREGCTEQSSEQAQLEAVQKQLEHQELLKLTNKLKIVEEAVENLKFSSEDASETDEPISEDWLNYFDTYAEKISSADMRALWARVLSGEMKRPNSFSLRTLRALSEIDAKTASLFERYARDRISDQYLIKSDKPIEGEELTSLIDLEEAGLVTNALDSSLERNWAKQGDGRAYIADGGFVSAVVVDQKLEKLSLPVFTITRVGQEICTLLDTRDPVDCLERISRTLMERGSISSAQIGKILNYEDGQLSFSIIKEL